MSTKVLLVCPRFPFSFWGMDFSLSILGKKAVMPPLPLAVIAALFPEDGYELKIVDMNIESLLDQDICNADLVLVTAMIVQKNSLKKVIEKCNELKTAIIVGGPYATSYSDVVSKMGECCIVQGEVEDTFNGILEDFQKGCLKSLYEESEKKPSLSQRRRLRFDLFNLGAYVMMCIQFSRGCPFDCKFCDITTLYGRVTRTKDITDVLAELQCLYDLNWRGRIFIVDDNFIGNIPKAMLLCTAIAKWQADHGNPFSFIIEASLNLSKYRNLMEEMSRAGFDRVFVGIESPNPDTLKTAEKGQNIGPIGTTDYLLKSIRTIQECGLMVTGGFILGMDGDDKGIFEEMIKFIQKVGIVVAMVGLLTALRNTKLYNELLQKGRLLSVDLEGDNTGLGSLNFKPDIPRKDLIAGYLKVIGELYSESLENYYERCLHMFQHLKQTRPDKIKPGEFLVLTRFLFKMIFSRRGIPLLKFLWKVGSKYPNMLYKAVELAIIGYHFSRYTQHLFVK